MSNLLHSMGFDPYAMIAPRTEADVIALLDEALSELANIHSLLDKLFAKLEGDQP